MKAVDSNVVIAAFASWHEHHGVAKKALAERPRLVAHAAIETYSVLPACPHRTERDPRSCTPSSPNASRKRSSHCRKPVTRNCSQAAASGHILGGPAHDALIAFTAAEHEATLLSLDQRAAATYEAVGATVDRLTT